MERQKEDNFFAKHKQSIYMGHTFPCAIKLTINKGSIVYENGKMVDENRKGKWLKPRKNQI